MKNARTNRINQFVDLEARVEDSDDGHDTEDEEYGASNLV
jgi:hypothetical protein